MPLHKPPLILIVDDDSTTNVMLQSILKNGGLQTCSAYDAAEATKMIRLKRPDLILLDIGLPDGSGIDLCRHIHQEMSATQTPILFISSNDDVSVKVQGFEAGGVDYITKPLSGIEILARVSTHLRLRSAYEKLAELQAERVCKLATTQEAVMPSPNDLPDAKFHIVLRQILAAGGDFYDVIPSGDFITDYIIADASGHDLSASYWTAALKALLATYADSVNKINDVMLSINSSLRRIMPTGVFFTMLYARLNRRLNRLFLANAGHPAAILLRANGEPMVIRQEGDVLGPFDDAVFGFKEVEVAPGDRFLLYTDGLVELGNDSDAEIDRLAKEFAKTRTSPLEQQLFTIVNSIVSGRKKKDDILLMGVEV